MQLLEHILLAGLATTASAQSTPSTCHDYVLVSIRGTGEAQGPSIGLVGMINQTLTTVPNGIEYDVVYPAARNQSFQSGSADAVRYITTGLSSCPEQKYALLGYSQGASAIMGALMNYTTTTSPLYTALAAIVTIGNPYHIPNASAAVNVDQFGGSTTRQYAGGLYSPGTPGAEGIPDVYYSSGKLLDICFQADIVCATKYPNASFAAHLGYIANPKVQSMGAEHIIARLKGDAGSTSNGTTTVSASAGIPSATASSTSQPIPTGAAVGSVTALKSGMVLAGLLSVAMILAL